MENKRLKELFIQVRLELMDENNDYKLGICNVINSLHERSVMTECEYNYLWSYLRQNKPSPYNQYKEFIDNEQWSGTTYWWTKMCYSDVAKRQRTKFLKQLISDITK